MVVLDEGPIKINNQPKCLWYLRLKLDKHEVIGSIENI